ncbi:MAG TPA: aldo/keto reductase [Pirellulaceae bacterium]|nr:aldo/keto reductase [Pirellulaceae bacterium]
MLFRPLGRTGVEISSVSFGAGPVSALLTDPQRHKEQLRTVQRAIDLGINWFDTAATYGDGKSEESLGRALEEISSATARTVQSAECRVQSAGNSALCTLRSALVHVATKVRIPPDCTHDLRGYVLQSCEQSLKRLKLPRVTLLQVHNSITLKRGDLPTSLAPTDVLDPGGVLEGMLELQNGGLVEHLGLTGLGDPAALTEVLRSGHFATVQAPYNLLNPSAGREMPTGFGESNLGNLFATCQELNIGVLAIRVYAGGALTGQPPSAHTLTTKFFPLDLYQRDQARAAALEKRLPPGMSLPEVALRFAIAHPGVASALVGFGSPEQVEQAVAFAERGPLAAEEVERLLNCTRT